MKITSFPEPLKTKEKTKPRRRRNLTQSSALWSYFFFKGIQWKPSVDLIFHSLAHTHTHMP